VRNDRGNELINRIIIFLYLVFFWRLVRRARDTSEYGKSKVVWEGGQEGGREGGREGGFAYYALEVDDLLGLLVRESRLGDHAGREGGREGGRDGGRKGTIHILDGEEGRKGRREGLPCA